MTLGSPPPGTRLLTYVSKFPLSVRALTVAASAVAALVCGVILLARLSVIAEAQAARDRDA